MRKRARLTLMTAMLASSAMAVGSRPLLAQAGAGDGFLFRAPQGAFSFRLGVARPSAQSRVFEFTSDQLTVNRGDFIGMSAAADFDLTITKRLAFQIGAGFSAREAGSEYRDFVDNNDLPIEQRTTFRRAPFTTGLKLYLTSPGRSLGRFAWVPSKVTPYVAGGAGLMYYSFRQEGDFVDFEDFAVFPSTLESSGVTSMAYGAVGVNYSLSSRFGLVTEARYDRAKAPMGSDFLGFDRIDLSGIAFTTGIHIRY